MATAKAIKAAQLRQAAARLDSLAGNARVLRSPALWDQYHEAVRMVKLLGFTVVQTGTRHEVRPC